MAWHHHVVQRLVHHLAEQKKVLGLVEADADAKKAAARTAMLFSRTNTLLSIPMLYGMVSAQNLY